MTRTWLCTLILLAASAATADAADLSRLPQAAETVDLTKLDRSIAKEPRYTAKPEYCLMVFGPKAETRVWLVRDGGTLYIDRNGNGDLTEPGEAHAATHPQHPWWDRIGDIPARDGKTKYRVVEVQSHSQGYRIEVAMRGDRFQSVGAMQAEKPRFAAQAKDAPICHFDGPLALAQYSTKRVIPRDNSGSNRARSLRLMVGTPGLGAGTFAAYECCLCEKLGPLVAAFEFSPLPALALSKPPIKTTQTFAYDD